jgi:hypothetical protein
MGWRVGPVSEKTHFRKAGSGLGSGPWQHGKTIKERSKTKSRRIALQELVGAVMLKYECSSRSGRRHERIYLIQSFFICASLCSSSSSIPRDIVQ